MTAWNIRLDPIDASRSPPWLVSAVTVGTRTFDGLWTIGGLEAGATGMMIGVIELWQRVRIGSHWDRPDQFTSVLCPQALGRIADIVDMPRYGPA